MVQMILIGSKELALVFRVVETEVKLKDEAFFGNIKIRRIRVVSRTKYQVFDLHKTKKTPVP